MQYQQVREGWRVTFLEQDLKTSLPRRFVFQTPKKVFDMARRDGAEFNFAGRQALETRISNGRGGVWLNLSEAQYTKLR